MTRSVMEMFGIEFPLFAFSHCRDVVAAVTNAGGFGVLGASNFTPAELEQELTWIDDHVQGRPYGVDVVCPEADAGKAIDLDPAALAARVPQTHRDFVNTLMREHDLAIELHDDDLVNPIRVDHEIGVELLEVSLRHPIKLVANALGVPPAHMIEGAHAKGIPVAALVGTRDHALRQLAAGVDLIVAQGSEAGGHTGEVSTLVLVPEVVAAVRETSDVPVLAAGGIVTGSQMAASIALGAQGVWTGSVWLTTEEAETPPVTVQKMLSASSKDTIRSRGRTGKPSRQLKSDWTAAWEADGSPAPLPMPLQSLISEPALRRVDNLAENGNARAADLATYFVGQGVGLMNKVKTSREVVREMAEEFIEAAERVSEFLDD
jgi:NAD(P)H-dependent flavin oxidoreductase YrpB (nitropropane dioxygenase family)